MTLNDIIRSLKRKGLTQSEIRAVVVFRYGIGAEEIPLRLSDVLDGTAALADADMIAGGEPVEYIIGTVRFFGAEIKVTRDVLIPRVETELLCDEVCGAAKDINAERIADVCTGSGCIAVSLAKKLRIKIDAFDISRAALTVAGENAEKNGVAELVDLYETDVLAKNDFFKTEYDIIVSNPPYISAADMEKLPDSVRREPATALYGGEDGLDFYRALTGMCKKHIRRGGALFFEIGDGEGDGVRRIAASCGLSAEVKNDLAGRERIVRIDI